MSYVGSLAFALRSHALLASTQGVSGFRDDQIEVNLRVAF